jgi:hypothetical protein
MSSGTDLYSVARVWPQLAHVTIITVTLATRSLLPSPKRVSTGRDSKTPSGY